jgi:hypothetical protein
MSLETALMETTWLPSLQRMMRAITAPIATAAAMEAKR